MKNQILINEDLPNEFENFRISSNTQKTLKSIGINNLFQIQSATYDLLYEKNDLIGRDRTGSGKTLAFSLPILERFREEKKFKSKSFIKMLIMVPTRELATQTFNNMISLKNHTNEFNVLSVYGGTSINYQISNLEKGVDILVATPGRLIDLMDREVVPLENLEVIVFDETDEMLKIGFQKDIEYILEKINNNLEHDKLQYLLFSATIPEWVKRISKMFMDKNYYFVNMVDKELNQTSQTIQHLKIKCKNSNDKIELLNDLISLHVGTTGRGIIFIDSKRNTTFTRSFI